MRLITMPASSAKTSGQIFISYRREDSAYAVGWLCDRLVEDFGAGQVFKDVDSIHPGDKFAQKIMAAVESCEVFLAVIGRDWLTAADGSGRRRIDYPRDFVRLEIETAMSRGVRVIPVLIYGAQIPPIDQLPPSLVELVGMQACELSHARFASDVERLLGTLRDLIGRSPGSDQSGRPGASRGQPAFDAADFAAKFGVLNPAEGARRLVVLPLDDAAVVLGNAPVSVSAEVLEILLADDERQEFAISLLAQIRKSKAQELIEAIPSAPPLLTQLPAAADAIERCRRELGR
ncbi:MAG: toll/interleukin-1 receptor domain-containing protein, partial [Chloroflexota bacterium]